MLRTRTVCVLNIGHDVEDYIELLADQGWPVVRTRSLEYGRIVEVTFAY